MENNDLLIDQIQQLIGSSIDENIDLAFQMAAGLNLTEKVIQPWRDLYKICKNEFKTKAKSNLEKVKSLTSIDTLFLDDCKLRELPIIVTYLKQLYKLDLSGNFIDELPETIVNMSNLIILDLSNNNLKTIPERIFTMEILENLNLSKNSIEEIDKLPPNLNALNISQNNFKKTPEFLFKKNKLIGLDISKNPGFVWDLTELDVKKLHFLTFDETEIENLKNMDAYRYAWFDDDGKMLRLIGSSEDRMI